MKKLLLAGLLSAFSVAAPEAWADWLNPTQNGDCQTHNWPIQERLFTAQREASSCFQEHWGTRGNGPGTRTFVCTIDKFGERRSEIPACSGLEQRVCDLSNEIQRRLQTCRPRLRAYLDRQAALAAREEELERLARENALSARLGEAGGQVSQQLYEQLPGGPGNLADSARIAGHGMAQLSGVRMTGQSGAYSLSSAMSIVGNRVISGLNERALGDLEAAFGDFNANNPRPTASQLEEFYAQRADLAGQYGTHMTRVQNTDYTLPLDDQSAVVGAYARTIVQLVQMRNAGEIDEPIAVLGAAAATFLAVRAYRDAEERAVQTRGPDVPQAVSAEVLRENRQTTLQTLREARAAVTRLPRPPALPAPAQVVTPTSQGFLGVSCLHRTEPNRLENACEFPVACFTNNGGRLVFERREVDGYIGSMIPGMVDALVSCSPL